MRIKDHACRTCYDSGGGRCSLKRPFYQDALLSPNRWFRAIREQDERHTMTLEFPRKNGTSIVDSLPNICSGQGLMDLRQSEKEDIFGLSYSPSSDQFLSDRPEQLSRLCQHQS